MVKREKRLNKAISSLEKQVTLHEAKKKLAEELGQIELVGYYTKEIASLTNRKKDREEKLHRKD